MHALQRPHLPRAMMVTVIAAVLAIVLTLTLAPRLNDLSSIGTAGTPPTVKGPTTSRGWNVSPFAPLRSSPVAAPWASTQP